MWVSMSGLRLEKIQSYRNFLIYAHLREIVHIFIDMSGRTLRSDGRDSSLQILNLIHDALLCYVSKIDMYV